MPAAAWPLVAMGLLVVEATCSMEPPAAECVILVGLPGAGKTTLYRRHFAATHLHVSKDLWPSASNRERRQQRLLSDALSRGDSVVVDNTNPRVADRAPVIALARARGARVIGYFFDITTRQSVARNAEREGTARVPMVAIFTTAKRLEPPTFAEGFDQLFRVELTPDRALTVTEITENNPSQSCAPR